MQTSRLVRRALLFLLLMTTLAPAFAQQERDAIEVIRSQIATNRKALVAENLGLSPEQSERFWPVYRRYQSERESIVDRRVKLLTEFRDHYDSLTDQKARDLLDRYMKYRQDLLKLDRKYIREFRKVLSDRMLLRYLQIENKINTIIDYDLVRVVPLAE